MDKIEALNQTLFLAINGPADTPRWIVDMAIMLGEYLIYLVPLLLVWMWLWGGGARREMALKAFIIAFVCLGVNQLIGLVWVHPRPFMMGIGQVWLVHVPDSSFPSDHVTVLASVGLSLLFDGAMSLGGLVLAVGLIVAWARIFVGVHFPLDMAGAAVIAALGCVGFAPLWRWAGAVVTGHVVQIYRKLGAFPVARGWIRP